MLGFLEIMLGAPLTATAREETFAGVVANRTPEAAMDFLRWGAGHNTEKSGALLGAQAIFVVVDTFVLDRGWPKSIVLASLFLLLAAALVLMTNLRNTMRAWRLARSADAQLRHVFAMSVSRTIRFNLALYLTFLSIVLLGAATAGFLR